MNVQQLTEINHALIVTATVLYQTLFM